ncbi:MAG: hypothetical protein AMDU2_EPLC00007G0051 [Thermoplasmatales archaeon E-plasma]|jgi:hypothetical protein|nr:MAG: hypothetical protein AMDU2_EPLC00007G0051 [Thermoplasmatales archaeon E-plasma]MCL4347971.1 hypothetical protein [Candidatus Thermoplasmatota archaeon]MCL5788165.1 hypothetical protein [Candidatus Thermoplasmatota archaeon]
MTSRGAAGDITYLLALLAAIFIVLNAFIDLIAIIVGTTFAAIHSVSFGLVALTGLIGIIVSIVALLCGSTILSITERMRRSRKEHAVNGIIIMILSIVALIGGGGFLIGTLFGLVAGFIIMIK